MTQDLSYMHVTVYNKYVTFNEYTLYMYSISDELHFSNMYFYRKRAFI